MRLIRLARGHALCWVRLRRKRCWILVLSDYPTLDSPSYPVPPHLTPSDPALAFSPLSRRNTRASTKQAIHYHSTR